MNSEKSRIYGASFISRTWIGCAGGNNPERILAAIFHGYRHLTAPGMPCPMKLLEHTQKSKISVRILAANFSWKRYPAEKITKPV